MNDVIGNDGIFIDPVSPSTPIPDFDLGSEFRKDFLSSNFWSRYDGVVYPTLPLDKVAIGATSMALDEKLHVAGKIYASSGYLLGSGISITKDGSGNIIFTDPVAGSVTLASLSGASGGNVSNSGTPTVGQVALWVDDTTIEGVDIADLTISQSQVTDLGTVLSEKAATIHNLIDTTNHPVSGLTAGHFLKALSETTYGFAAHGLDASAIGLGDVTNHAQVRKIAESVDNQIVRWDGVTGALVQSSLATVSDTGTMNIPSGQTYNINGTPHTHASVYEPASAKLSAIAGMDSSVGFIYQTGADTFTKYGFAGSGEANTVARSDHDHILNGDYAPIENPEFIGTVTCTGDIIAFAGEGPEETWWDAMPYATATTVGGIKVGANLSIDINGVLNAEAGEGGGAWGEIGGTITDQTDLITYVATKIHNLIDTTNHTVSGLTTGHFLKALSATSYGFAAHGLTYTDVGAAASGHGHSGVYEPVITAGTSAQYWRGDKSWQTLNAASVGLGNVTNESKATMFTNPTFTGTVSGVTATHVGLGNVTNESKATMFTSPTFTGTVTGVTATHVGLGNVTNESKSTMFTNPTFTGTVSGVTATHVGLGNVTNESKATMFNNSDFTGVTTAGRLHVGGTSDPGDNNLLVDGIIRCVGDIVAYYSA